MLHNALRKAPSGQEISPKSLLILGYGIIKNNALQISTCPVPKRLIWVIRRLLCLCPDFKFQLCIQCSMMGFQRFWCSRVLLYCRLILNSVLVYFRLLTYPPPPEKGGINITNEDLYCLQEGEFLNDVIIDFYLKYECTSYF